MQPSRPGEFTLLFIPKGQCNSFSTKGLMSRPGTIWSSLSFHIIPNEKIVKDYSPISLFNACYKIVASAINNWLRLVWVKIVDFQQSALVPGHLMTNNVLGRVRTYALLSH